MNKIEVNKIEVNKIEDLEPTKEEFLGLEFSYQPELTKKLDDSNIDFNQELINEIVLWKVNRYVNLTDKSFSLLNKIDPTDNSIDKDLTNKVLEDLLTTKGIRLPMASTILKFKNPNIYQIIDQRVYRVIYGTKLKLKNKVEDSITQYLSYLEELERICDKYKIPFSESDRILYSYDKKINKGKKINY